MKLLLSTIIPFVLLAQPHPAPLHAAVIREVSVSTAGLDLATPTGAAAMLRRIRDAATHGCAQDQLWDRYSADYRRCRLAVAAYAVAQLDAPLVTALHADDQTVGAQMIAAASR